MTAYEIVCRGLEDPDDAAFRDAMRPELQRRLLEFSSEDWERLGQECVGRPAAWRMQLCEVLSPSKHGRPATQLLLALAQEGSPDVCDIATAKVLASQALNATERGYLHDTLQQRGVAGMGHHAAQQRQSLLQQLAEPITGPSIAEACDYSIQHKAALEASWIAACYYCQTVFPASMVSEFTDGGETALCPYCGIDAVLPSAAGYDFSQASLQALNEFWFH